MLTFGGKKRPGDSAVDDVMIRRLIARNKRSSEAMIKIEEICMLYENSPKEGLSIISDLVESTLEGNR